MHFSSIEFGNYRRRAAGLAATLVAMAAITYAQAPGRDLHEEFLNPPPEARPMMRWWWFGPAVTKPELKKELETMRGAGIGGAEIQPVYPMMLDDRAKGIKNFSYLSPEFLSAVSYANTTARALGLRVDITLGSGWPYGGPKTTLALAAGRLKVVTVPVAGTTVTAPKLAAGDSFIAAFEVSGTGKSFDAASARRIDPAPPSLPLGSGERTVLYFIASHTHQAVKRAAFGAEGNVLDHMSRAAIDEHLTDVATPLLKAFGNEPPYSVFSDSLEVYGSDWTENLPAEFQRRRGYDLIPHLPELLAGGTAQADAVRHDWGVTLSDLVRENYLSPLTKFAEAHHTKFRSQTYGMPGVTLADQAVSNLPEGEGPQWRSFSFTRWASSANHLYGNSVTSAETWTWLHSPAFRATPLDMKAEADRMFLLGVNQFIGHGFPYSPAGAGEPGWSLYAAAVFNSHSPWFAVMPDITKYLQRMSWLLRQGKPANDVAILLPEDDAQAAFAPGGRDSVTDEMKRWITPVLMGAILDAGYNIDYIDATTIEKLGTIPYPVVVMPSTERMPLAAYKKIESYAAGTGRVIALGARPSLAPGLMEQSASREVAAVSARLFTESGHKGVVVDSLAKLPDALHQALTPDVAAKGQTEGFGFIHRKLTDSDVYFVANTGNKRIDAALQFRSAYPVVEAWDLDSGKVLMTAATKDGAGIPLVLAPYESRVFELKEKSAEKPGGERAAATEKELADLSGGWTIRFGAEAKDQALTKLGSWTELEGRKYFSGEASYARSIFVKSAPAVGKRILLDFGMGKPTVDTRPPGSNGIRALLDPPVGEAAIILVNGVRVGSLWHPPYRIDITNYMHSGTNQVTVRVFNTAINLMAGQPPRDFSALYAKYGRRFDMQDMDNLQPIPSGLMGRVKLVEKSW